MAVLDKPSGIATSGPDWATRRYISANNGSTPIIYVNSSGGDNANTGLRRDEPKANVFGTSGTNAYQAATTAKSNLIVVEAGHTESISGAWDGAAGRTWSSTQITLLGLGEGSTRPRFTAAVDTTITVTGAMTRFVNLYFPASTVSIAAARLSVTTGAGFLLKDCAFECGASDTADTVLMSNASGDHFRAEGCTWTVTAEGAARGFLCAAAVDNPTLVDCTFDGSSFGWDGDACAFTSGAPVAFQVHNLTLSNYSVFNAGITGATGFISGIEADATSSWKWTE